MSRILKMLPIILLAVVLLSLGSVPILQHPHAHLYQPWITVVWLAASVLGGVGAAATPSALTLRQQLLARSAMAVAFSCLAGVSLVVLTDWFCLAGYLAPDGSCSWE